ncbi:hypothetical protein D0Z07_1591 [Hyphodiscus hymeniophilus]|uniref:F-box domain-containing protein n=1 Tax=Hyphodiscus hymeniophilus TaxID=353542 RepID=A0A9P6VNN8_9HELO|nr:hypothetical protein D0Z07_1591 [Hyphodiscus hymeniophilus]
MAQSNGLLSLPDELLNTIFKDVRPWDLASLAWCCRRFRLLLRENRSLFKDVYLRLLTRRLPFVTDSVVTWMQTALPSSRGLSKNIVILSELFAGRFERDNKEAFFQHSTIFGRARRDRLPLASSGPVDFLSPEERQMSAKLHTLYGVPVEFPRRSLANAVYPYACSVVYDLRNYTAGNLWGPYKDDGLCTVDWERLEAVMIVLGHNLKNFTENTRGLFGPVWNIPWLGASPDSFSPMAPFNVSGTWMRVRSLLHQTLISPLINPRMIDFTELFAYNFNSQSLSPSDPRPPLETTEAIRLITMELQVVRVSDPSENEGLSPIVYFEGVSRSMHTQWDPNANSKIKGTVRLTREGEVRWTSISVYQEIYADVISREERWASEGIQIGGAKSSRGVLGHWFDKDLDQHGPAGPTAFWKVSNDIRTSADSDDEFGESLDADDEVDAEDENGDESEDEEIEVQIEGIDDVNELTADQIAFVLQAIAGGHVSS